MHHVGIARLATLEGKREDLASLMETAATMITVVRENLASFREGI